MKVNTLSLSLAATMLVDGTLTATAATVVQFLGTSENIGEINVANDLYGMNVKVEEAFPQGLQLGQSFGCEKLPMTDFETQQVIGEGVDCSWFVADDTAVASITFFHFAETDSTMAHYLLIGMAPFTDNVGTGPLDARDPNSPIATFMSASQPDNANTCVAGTGDFVGAQGNVRLSAAFSMEPALFLNCIYELDMQGEPVDIVQSRSGGGPKERMVLQLEGKGELLAGGVEEANEIAGLGVDKDDALEGIELLENLGCHKIPMYDFITGELKGDGVDCIWSINGGFATISYHVFESSGSAIATADLVSVGIFVPDFGDGPVVFGDANSPYANIMTGSMTPTGGTNTIIATSGEFEGYEGNTRLGGGVNVVGDGTMWFDSIFEFHMTAPEDGNNSGAAASSTILSVSLLTFILGWLFV